jgi:hypothetical protein
MARVMVATSNDWTAFETLCNHEDQSEVNEGEATILARQGRSIWDQEEYCSINRILETPSSTQASRKRHLRV